MTLVEFRTQALALNDTAASRIRRANLYLELREWDKAFVDVDKANAVDPSDATVKEWLPRFELLRKLLPRIKTLDAQIGKSQGAAALWLDRAHQFALANWPNLALRDCRQAMKLEPGMMRARVQTGEALQDLGRGEEAAKLQVSYNLARDENKHVNEGLLRALGVCDVQVLQYSNQADPLIARAKASAAPESECSCVCGRSGCSGSRSSVGRCPFSGGTRPGRFGSHEGSNVSNQHSNGA